MRTDYLRGVDSVAVAAASRNRTMALLEGLFWMMWEAFPRAASRLGWTGGRWPPELLKMRGLPAPICLSADLLFFSFLH